MCGHHPAARWAGTRASPLRCAGTVTELNVSENQLAHFDGLQMLAQYLQQKPPPPIALLNVSNNDLGEVCEVGAGAGAPRHNANAGRAAHLLSAIAQAELPGSDRCP